MFLSRKEIKWNRSKFKDMSIANEYSLAASSFIETENRNTSVNSNKKHGRNGKRRPLPLPCALAVPPTSHWNATSPSLRWAPHSMTREHLMFSNHTSHHTSHHTPGDPCLSPYLESYTERKLDDVQIARRTRISWPWPEITSCSGIQITSRAISVSFQLRLWATACQCWRLPLCPCTAPLSCSFATLPHVVVHFYTCSTVLKFHSFLFVHYTGT